MEEIGKSALIAIVGMMASAAMVAGGAAMRPDALAPGPVSLPATPTVKPAVPLAALPRDPEQPVPAPYLSPATRDVSAPAHAGADAGDGRLAPRIAEARLPSLEGSGRPPSPDGKPPPPLSSFARGPEQPALALKLPTAPPDVAPPAAAHTARAAEGRPPRVAEAGLPALDGASRPPNPDGKPPPPLSSFARGPEQPVLALNLPTAPPDMAPPAAAHTARAAEGRPPRIAEPGLPALGGSARPPNPDGKPPPPLSTFSRGPEQPAVALKLPSVPPDVAPLVAADGVNARELVPPRIAEARLPGLSGAARPPKPDGKPPPRPAEGERAEIVVATLSPPTARPDTGAPPPVRDGGLPAWRRYAALAPADTGAPMVAIIIDDLGLNKHRLARTIALPRPLTLAILPYSENIEPWVQKARAAGHELMLHLPMEPGDPAEDPGPNALLADLDATELARRIEWNLGRFEGYVGVNNHMGSRFTASSEMMRPLIHRLSEGGLLFVDSLTTNLSVGRELAQAAGVPSAARDIFLDNDIDVVRIRAQLEKVERCAIRKGYCIAIGHPHPETLSVLEAWLPGLAARGFVLVPVSAIVARRMTG